MERLNLKGLVSKAADDGVYYGRASTAAVDRSGEIVRPSAFRNVGDWVERNPVMYYDHAWTTSLQVGETSLPVAKATEAKVTESELVIGFKFSDLPFAQQVKYLVDEGFLNSLSVGFLPKTWETDKDGRRVYTDVELLEVSVVGIPANAEATIMRSLKDAGRTDETLAKIASAYAELKSGRGAKAPERGTQAGARSVEPGGVLTVFERQTIAKNMGGKAAKE